VADSKEPETQQELTPEETVENTDAAPTEPVTEPENTIPEAGEAEKEKFDTLTSESMDEINVIFDDKKNPTDTSQDVEMALTAQEIQQILESGNDGAAEEILPSHADDSSAT
jgi:hypothetical protein